MATWIYLGGQSSPTSARYRTLFPGQSVNDAQVTLAPYQALGAVFWPASDPVVATAAAKVFASRRALGADPALAASRMFAACAGATNAQAEGWPGSAAFQSVAKFTATIGFAQLTASATTQTIVPVGLLLPANTRVIARTVRVATGFTGGALSATTISFGGNGSSNDIVSSASVFAVASLAGTSGNNANPDYVASTQVSVIFTSTGGNVNAATAGSVTIDLLVVGLP